MRSKDPRKLCCLQSTKSLIGAALLSLASTSWSAPVSYTFSLTDGVPVPSPSPLITVNSPLEDSNGDTWQETVLRINLGDPATANPYHVAEFRIFYGGSLSGQVNLNIGDSITNNGGGGDSATQSNDAELNIGTAEGDVTDMFVQASDAGGGGLIQRIDSLVGPDVTLDLLVSDGFLGWNNHLGNTGSIASPGLFALAGQPDFEGPVNYDIYAGFNRVINGAFRQGGGIEAVTVCLRAVNEESCLEKIPDIPVPEPGSLLLLGGAGLALVLGRRSGRQRESVSRCA